MELFGVLSDGTKIEYNQIKKYIYKYTDGSIKVIDDIIVNLIKEYMNIFVPKFGIDNYENENELLTFSFKYPNFYFLERKKLYLNLIRLNIESGDMFINKIKILKPSIIKLIESCKSYIIGNYIFFVINFTSITRIVKINIIKCDHSTCMEFDDKIKLFSPICNKICFLVFCYNPLDIYKFNLEKFEYKIYMKGKYAINHFSFNNNSLIISSNDYIQVFNTKSKTTFKVYEKINFPTSILRCGIKYDYSIYNKQVIAAYNLIQYDYSQVRGIIVILNLNAYQFEIIFIPYYASYCIEISIIEGNFKELHFKNNNQFIILTDKQFYTYNYPNNMICKDIFHIIKRPSKLPIKL